MRHSIRKMTAGLACAALLTAAFAGQASAGVVFKLDKNLQNAVNSAGQSAAQTEAGQSAGQTAEGALFQQLDGTVFGFMSGVGAWETTMTVKPDGSFSGEFHDMNMGESGEGYENGTVYDCEFKGRFSAPVKLNETSWSAKVAELHYRNNDGGAYQFIDEEKIRHILTVPYGLSKDAEIVFYLPGTPVASLSEECQSWLWFYESMQNAVNLRETCIWNDSDQTAFYPDHYAMGDTEAFNQWLQAEIQKEAAAAQGAAAQETAAAQNTASQETAAAQDPAAQNPASTESRNATRYDRFRYAYENQAMPGYEDIPQVFGIDPQPSAKYPSVTLENLQGRWVNRYVEAGAHMEEILTINGDRAMIESYSDGVPTFAWNGDGILSIENRDDRNVCPAVRVTDFEGNNVCTIYIRWVKDNAFYDGGFNNEWKRENPADLNDQYLYNTVNIGNLQGVWYSEYDDSAGHYQVVLRVSGNKAAIYEELNGVPDSIWNGEGVVSFELTNHSGQKYWPLMKIDREDGSGNIAAIYITNVEEGRFYDAGLNRWYMKID